MTVLLNSGTSELLIQPPKIIESDMNVVTGYMPFKGFKTFYRVVGEPSDKAPLVLLHGRVPAPLIIILRFSIP